MSAKKPRSQKAKTAKSPINGAEIPLGAHPGNTGGKPGRSGRPPSVVRDVCSLRFEERVPLLANIADGTAPLSERCPQCGYEGADAGLGTVETRDRLRAIDMLGKYGLGERSEFSEDVVTANVDKMLTVAQALMAPEDFAAFCKQADTIWNGKHG